MTRRDLALTVTGRVPTVNSEVPPLGFSPAHRGSVKGDDVTGSDSGGPDSGSSGPVGSQPALFGVEQAGGDPLGYRGPTACSAAGITYRQLDYWARTGLVEPTVRPAHGSGSQRLYSFRDILLLKVVKRLLDTGVSLQNIRAAVSHLRDRGDEDLTGITLMSDGTTVYACTSADEVVDLVQGGQGVFGIAVGRVVLEVEGTLSELPAERAEPAPGAAGAADELAQRRRRRTSA
jgi:DNA-binding transcriptional MerR regulator